MILMNDMTMIKMMSHNDNDESRWWHDDDTVMMTMMMMIKTSHDYDEWYDDEWYDDDDQNDDGWMMMNCDFLRVPKALNSGRKV